MALTVTWGGSQGDVTLPFKGNSILSGARIRNPGPDDDVTLEYYFPADWAFAFRLDQDPSPNEGSAGGDLDVQPPHVLAADGWVGDQCLKLPQTEAGASSSASEAIDTAEPLTLMAWVRFPQPADTADSFYFETTATRTWGFVLEARSAWNTWGYALYVEVWNEAGTKWYWRGYWTWQDSAFEWDQWHLVGMGFQPGQMWIGCLSTGWLSWPTPSDPARSATAQLRIRTLSSATIDRFVSGLWLDTSYRDPGTIEAKRYVDQGQVTLLHELAQAYRLTAIDWQGIFGPGAGRITKVEALTATGWQTVAEDPAGLVPPLTGLDIVVSGPELIRVTLAPSQDSLQSEAPTLDWIQAVLEPVHVPKPPFRAGTVSAAALRSVDTEAVCFTTSSVHAEILLAEHEQP